MPATPEFTHYTDLISRGTFMENMGNFNGARGFYERAREIFPDLALALESLARVAVQERKFDEAVTYKQKIFDLRFGMGTDREYQKNIEGELLFCTGSKLRHDVEQFEYLHSKKLIDDETFAHVQKYRDLLGRLKGDEFQRGFRLTPQLLAYLEPLYNRGVHVYRPPALKGPAVNPKLDVKKIEDSWVESGQVYAVIDDFLTAEALNEMRRFCLESTFWFRAKPDGYFGVDYRDGFFCGLLYQISAETQDAFQRIVGINDVIQMWGFKYDEQKTGTGLHGDPAILNANFWLTPDSANLDPESGGLLVYRAKPPPTWNIIDYNSDEKSFDNLLKKDSRPPIKIPYRANRMVIFDSALVHTTDSFKFKPGYENRRTNITLLYGKRAHVSKASSAAKALDAKL